MKDGGHLGRVECGGQAGGCGHRRAVKTLILGGHRPLSIVHSTSCAVSCWYVISSSMHPLNKGSVKPSWLPVIAQLVFGQSGLYHEIISQSPVRHLPRGEELFL